jgi:two-component system LytT family response regulator
MTSIHALIVDDEEFARENLRMMLEDFCPGVVVDGMASNAREARKMVEECNPDVIFLDIMMPGEDGFDFLKSLDTRNFQIVFTTAFREYALRAIRESALDYLEKPIDIEELQLAVQKVRARVEEKKSPGITGERMSRILEDIALTNTVEKTIIPTKDGFAVIRNAEIIHLEASENYTTLYCAGGKRYVSSKSIKAFEERLDPRMFFRVHKSHIINMANHLREFNRADGNLAILSDGTQIPVARRKLQEFLERLGQIS